jgi:threonine dehydrogenase-like Zn-dependent dehydrogenase
MLIQTTCSLISSGTELSSLRNKANLDLSGEETWRQFGYQSAGIVVDANGCPGFANGDRVASLGGGYASHSNWNVAPYQLTWKLPDEVSFEEGAFTNLLGTALWAVRRGQVEFGSHIAVVGLGVVGQLISQIARLSGAHSIGIDRVEMRQQLALSLGAEHVAGLNREQATEWKEQYTNGYGIDAGFVAFGGDASAVILELASVMRQAPDTHVYGKIVVVGGARINIPLPGDYGNIDICSSSRTGPGYHDKAWERGKPYPEAVVQWNTQRNIEECFRAIAAKKLQVERLITHRVEIDDVPEACNKLVENPDEALGVIVNYQH